ncbi:MAG: divergent polysaccharide deacetylase family protein [Candidatus Omnitrophica bacterium]|nr:divergent polysaccharide deacetylase family protein [Candidatus Omnitrophota bacterium]
MVIDDWGYNRSHCKLMADIPAPLGIAVLPHLPFSNDIVQCALENGKEPMLHLPLEPHNMREAFEADYLLTTKMSPSVVKKQLAKILKEMPGVVGVNNHTGSQGTEDEALMTLILAELKRRGLFFLDSFTSDRSQCGVAARKLKMRIARRDVFLDNRNEREAIESEFASAARIAKRQGHALIIGHDRALTLQIIKEQVKKLQAQGYEFIGVQEYIRQYEYPGN